MWARGYWVASSGNVTDEVWMDYIKNQEPPEPDDNFKGKPAVPPNGGPNPALSRNLKPPPLGGGVFTFGEPINSSPNEFPTK